MKFSGFFVVLVVVSFVVVPVMAQSYNVSSAWQGVGATTYVVSSGSDFDVWNYYQLLTVSNSSVVPVGFQLNFTVWYGVGTNSQGNFYLDGHGSPDFGDLRFVDGHGVLLNATYSSMTVSSFVHVWVKLEDSLTVVMYYGNPYVSSYWSEEDVWERIISDNLVISYPMLEGSGTAVNDYSGEENDGVITGSLWGSGKYVSGLNFTGVVGNKLLVAHDASLDFVNMSVVCWVYMSGVGSSTFPVFMKNYGSSNYPYEFDVVKATNRLQFRFFNGSWQTVTALIGSGVTWGSWHSIGVTYNGFNVNFYLDGVGSGDVALIGTLPLNTADSVVGWKDDAASYFNGTVSDLYVTDDVLSSAEVVDFQSYYPQVFDNHLGSVYLRWWLSPSVYGVVSAGEVSPNLVVAAVGLADYMPFFGLLVFVLLGLFVMFSRVPVLMIVVGVVGFAVAGLVFTTYHGVGVLFSPYSELLLALVCVFDFAVAGRMVKRG